MRMLAEGTHPDGERVLIDLLREAPPARKLGLRECLRPATTRAEGSWIDRRCPAGTASVWRQSELAFRNTRALVSRAVEEDAGLVAADRRVDIYCRHGIFGSWTSQAL